MLHLIKSGLDLDGHEQVFVERYEQMLEWSLHLTDHDRAQAEDLLHDAYIQFTLTRPDLGMVHNLDGYLYGVLRMLRLSHLRRTARSRLRQLSIIEYDSAEKGLRTIDPRRQQEICDDLRAVCRYACRRKESSKAGSVLILRFFLGYFPSEIAHILRSARKVVDMRLQAARREAKLFLEAPERLSFISINPAGKSDPIMTTTTGLSTNDLLQEMREEVFNSRQGDCLSPQELREMYRQETTSPIENPHLSHIVSCPQCLDQVNQILGLPSLGERYPTDTMGQDTSGKRRGGKDGGDDKPGGDGGTGGSRIEAMTNKSRNCVREVFEHRPQELHVAVNGLILGSQKIHAEINEQTLEINQLDLISFIEVFSEQETRLMLLPVGEQPPAGRSEQTARIELSDGRTLELTLSFRCPHPTLQVVYRDPLMRPDAAFGLEEDELISSNGFKLEMPQVMESGRKSEQTEITEQTEAFYNFRLFRYFRLFRVLPRPVFAIAVFLLLSAALLLRFLFPSTPAASAAELLQKSIAAEAQMAQPTEVTHRAIDLEERDAESNRLIARHRVEVWNSAARGVKARRLYNEQNRLVAGEWRKADGSGAIIRNPQSAIRNPEVWRLELASQDFSTLVGQAAEATVEERAEVYVLGYRLPPEGVPAVGGRVMRASLTLNKADLRATAQTLLMRGEDAALQLREYRFIESRIERLAADAVLPEVFEPDRELVGQSTRVMIPDSLTAPATGDSASDRLTATEIAEIEVEARYLLDQVNANLGEQVSIVRGEGRLQVRALAETDKRKEELLGALNPLRNRKGVSLDIATYAEAASREPKPPTGSVTISEAEPAQDHIPASGDLRRYFTALAQSQPQLASGREPDIWVEEQILRFANRMQSQSARPLRHARALKQLTAQLTPEELQTLSPESKTKWLKLVHTHALAIQRETENQRHELQPIFFPTTPAEIQTVEAVNSLNLTQIAQRLIEMTAAHDGIINQAFSKSTGNEASAAVKKKEFWHSLRSVERLSAQILKLQ